MHDEWRSWSVVVIYKRLLPLMVWQGKNRKRKSIIHDSKESRSSSSSWSVEVSLIIPHFCFTSSPSNSSNSPNLGRYSTISRSVIFESNIQMKDIIFSGTGPSTFLIFSLVFSFPTGLGQLESEKLLTDLCASPHKFFWRLSDERDNCFYIF